MEDSGNTLRIHLLGKFYLQQGEQPISGLDSPRLQSLVGYLIDNRQAPVARSRLAFTFWLDSTEAQAQTNLRHLLHRLHHIWAESGNYLVTDQKTIWWHPRAPWTCDLVEFDDLILRARAARDVQQERLLLTQACEIYAGEFLPGLYDDWILHTRERLEERFQIALERLVALFEAAGEYLPAIRYAERLLKIDLFKESTYRWLMQLHCRYGDRSAALYVYHQCSRILQRELGIQPGELIQTIYEQLLREPGTHLIPLLATEGFEPPLVSRKEQWEALLACWRGVITGKTLSHCVVIQGEAGIGKTSLVQAFVDWARRQGGTAMIACCYNNEGTLPYAPLLNWLRSFSLTGLQSTWLRELARLSPDLVDIPPQGIQIHEIGQRQRLYLALVHATLWQNQPILLALDDAHLADRDTLDWLLFLLHHNPRARLMLVLTQQTGETDHEHGLSQIRLELERNDRFTEITLQRLDRSGVKSLANLLANRSLTENMLDKLFDFSEGNPFFIVEAIRAYGLMLIQTESTGLVNLETSMKQTAPIQALISKRLEHLSPTAEKILETAAVIGRSFRADTVMLVTGFDEDILLNGLDELWRKGLILETDQQRYDFQHGLLRQYVYDRMSNSQRKHLHRKVAEALQIVYSKDLDPFCAELAHHFEIAGKLFEAADCYVQAFKVAQRLYSNQNAILYSEKALSLYCQLSQTTESEDVRHAMLYAQVDILCERDWTWRLMGRMADIQNDVQTLTKLNQQLCDNSLAAQIARLEASLHYRFCRLGEACDASQQGIELSQQIGDRRNEAYCTQILGRTLRAQGRYDDGLRMLRKAIALFQEINDPIEQVHCMSYISTLHWMESDYRAALQVAEETLAYCEQTGLTPQRRFALGDMGAAAIDLRNYSRAESWLIESLAMAREFDDRTQETFCLGHLGWLKFRQGQVSQALKSFQDAYELAIKCELLHYQSWLLSGLCLASAQNRESTQAHAYGESALYMAQRCGLPFATSLAKQSLTHLETLTH